MPIKSQAQRAFLHIHHPKIANRWEEETPAGKLPKHVNDGQLPELAAFFPTEDAIPGGKGAGADVSKFDKDELEKVTRHEMEHTDDSAIAREIAIDHLVEDPHYYSDIEAAGRLFSSE